MTSNIEHQIRRYTEALYADATPVERLAAGAVGEQLGQMHRANDRGADPGKRRSLSGPALAIGAAITALLAVIPLWLLAGSGDTTTTDPASATIVTSGTMGPFAGTWIGFDELDGSTNTLSVDGATNVVVYEETAATACRDPFGDVVSGSVTGSATRDGNRLEFAGTFYCNLEEGKEAVPFFEEFVWVIKYDPDSDTLSLVVDPSTLLHRSGAP
jgi:hypothetical protein